MRYPAVAGAFYDSDKNVLREEIQGYLKKAEDDLKARDKSFKQIFGIVVPHAGYIYSGPVAAYSYSVLKDTPEFTTFVIISPNHTGRGKPVALSREDWQTPLGLVKNDRELGDAIKRNCNLVDFDEEAHMLEHSAEVQLPFLQTLFKNVKAVEICMGIQDYEVARDLGKSIYQASKDSRRPIIVIASSDFTHYEAAELAKRNDEKAIKFIEEMKIREFVDTVHHEDMSICGYGPIAAAMSYAEQFNSKASLLKYANSGDATGDYDSVVGYASLVFWK